MFLLPHQIELFQGINDGELIGLIDQLAFRKFPKGFPIFQQGEFGTEVYAILSGEVEIVGHDGRGEYVSVAKLKPGAVFGEFSYFTGEPRSFNVMATEDCAILEIHASWLGKLAEKFPIVNLRIEALFRSRVLTNVLRATKLFSSLSAQELDQLSAGMKLNKYPDETQFLREGETGTDIFVIKQGKVAITKQAKGKRVTLKELGPGEVIGEMAAITGEPRSASATTVGPAEVLVLSGEHFAKLLKSNSSILSTMEDVVKHRSEQTRKALESLVSEVLEGNWEEFDEVQGLQVGSLNIHCKIKSTTTEIKAQVTEVSTQKWVVVAKDGRDNIGNDEGVTVEIVSGTFKFMQGLRKKDSFAARTLILPDKTMVLHFGPEASANIMEVLQASAKAKLQGLVFPKYEAGDSSIAAWIKSDAASEARGSLSSISLTNATLRVDGVCAIGQVLQLGLEHAGKVLLRTKALVLQTNGPEVELQLEYETSGERASIESIISFLSKGKGPQAAPSAVPSEVKPQSAAASAITILERRFGSAKEFIRAYLSSMEAGLLRMPVTKNVFAGMPVQILLFIPGFPGVRKAVLSGRVKSHAKGAALVELIDDKQELQTRLRLLFEKLMEVHADESWERRKSELVISVRRSLWEDRLFQRFAISTLLGLNVLLFAYIYAKLARVLLR